jgi:hypothetical protein
MSCRTPVIGRSTGRPSGGGKVKVQRGWVTYVLYDPFFETPDRTWAGTNGRLKGFNPYARKSSPAVCGWPFLCYRSTC